MKKDVLEKEVRDNEYFINYSSKIIKFQSLRNLIKMITEINRAEKVILHGLNESLTVLLLLFMPWNLKKCYWFSWGADIYKYQQDDLSLKLRILYILKRIVVNQLGYIVVTIEGEYKNIKKWFGARGKWISSFKYPSNLYKDQPVNYQSVDDGVTRILLGNSASPSNNHMEVLERIKQTIPKHAEYIIYCPLSYGDASNAKKVCDKGHYYFGDRFKPLIDFMPLDDYLNLLFKIDIAIFNHNRQQGMGNIITLLGMGKKVFIREDVTPWEFFNGLDINIFSINDLEFKPLDEVSKEQNLKVIRSYFSVERLKNELNKIFHSPNL
ncbi:MAG: TDP-N-acetylfucosamine:lipid II N-acetylfucosaminyltransferase [Balneolaceae bacterium]